MRISEKTAENIVREQAEEAERLKKREAEDILNNHLSDFTGLTYDEIDTLIEQKLSNLPLSAREVIKILAKWCKANTDRS